MNDDNACYLFNVFKEYIIGLLIDYFKMYLYYYANISSLKTYSYG